MKITFEEEKNSISQSKAALGLLLIGVLFVAVITLYYKGFLKFYDFAHIISFSSIITVGFLLKIVGALFYVYSILLLVKFILLTITKEDTRGIDTLTAMIVSPLLQIISILLM